MEVRTERQKRDCFWEEIRESFIEEVTRELAWRNGWEFGYRVTEEERLLGRGASTSKESKLGKYKVCLRNN